MPEFDALQEFPDLKSNVPTEVLIKRDVRDSLVGLSYAATLIQQQISQFAQDTLRAVLLGQEVPSEEALDINLGFYEAAYKAVTGVVDDILKDAGLDSIMDAFDESEVEAKVLELNDRLKAGLPEPDPEPNSAYYEEGQRFGGGYI